MVASTKLHTFPNCTRPRPDHSAQGPVPRLIPSSRRPPSNRCPPPRRRTDSSTRMRKATRTTASLSFRASCWQGQRRPTIRRGSPARASRPRTFAWQDIAYRSLCRDGERKICRESLRAAMNGKVRRANLEPTVLGRCDGRAAEPRERTHRSHRDHHQPTPHAPSCCPASRHSASGSTAAEPGAVLCAAPSTRPGVAARGRQIVTHTFGAADGLVVAKLAR